MAQWTDLIRKVPDFPKEGILFFDVMPVLKDRDALTEVIDAFAKPYAKDDVDVVIGIESRGFIFGAALADRLEAGFVPVRKPGKLPWKTFAHSYELEYGSDTLEIQQDALYPGQNVLIVDDLLATGGTCAATQALIANFDVKVLGASFMIELKELGGQDKLNGMPVHALLSV